MKKSRDPNRLPLCVDLDGTLIADDLVWESLTGLRRMGLRAAYALIRSAFLGRAALKRNLALNAPLDLGKLKFNQGLLRALEQARANGRVLVLATAADGLQAQKIAEYLGLFDEILASDGHTNLKGKRKAKRLWERYGRGGYDYVGNSLADLPVWQSARSSVLARADGRRPLILMWFAQRKGIRFDVIGTIAFA